MFIMKNLFKVLSLSLVLLVAVLALGSASPANATAPTVTLTATPGTITSGGSSTLVWSSTDATFCFGSGTGLTGNSSTSGRVVVTPSVTTTYFMACVNGTSLGYATTTVTVSPLLPLTITTASLPLGTVGIAYSQNLAATGGRRPYTWSLRGTLPAGLSLNSPTGVIYGIPTTTGIYNFTVVVNNTAVKNLSITVAPTYPLGISTRSLPNGTVGVAYSQNLVGVGGTAPHTWSIAYGTLPAGLSLNRSTGAISGIPTTYGGSQLIFRLTDSTSRTVTKNLPITIVANSLPPTIVPAPIFRGIGGVPFSQTLTATGGTLPYTWILEGTLPPGLSLNPLTGVISGTPYLVDNISFYANFYVRVSGGGVVSNRVLFDISIVPAS